MNAGDRHETPQPPYAKCRLLVVDDDQKLCRLLKSYLDPMGYEVEVAHTGPQGLEKALGDDLKAPKFIKTVRAIGYMMVAPESGTPK